MVYELSESDREWWKRPEDYEDDEDPRAHEKLIAVIRAIDREQDRKREFLLWGAMYGGGVPPAGGGMGVDAYIRTTPRGKSNLSLNLSRNVSDAIVSRIFAKSSPTLKYATEGGGPEHQQQALQMTKGLEGIFYQENANEACITRGRDGVVYGTGSLRAFPCFDTGKVKIVRYRPWERKLDDGEALMSGGQMSWYAERYEDRSVVAYMVREGHWADGTDEERAEKARMVEMLKGDKDEDAEFGFQQVATRIKVYEGWRQRPGKNAHGRYVHAVSNCTLIDRTFDGEFGGEGDEFSDYRWCKPIEGYYGQGIVELGQGIQAEVNKMVRQFQSACHMIAGKWLVANGSGVVSAHINNALDTILKYNAGAPPPQYVVPSIIDPQFVAHLWALCDRYYRVVGINEQMSAAMKPAGLKSGEAQREYAEQQTETLLDKGRAYDESVRDLGLRVARAARELSKRSHVYEVRALNDDGFETIDWSEMQDPDGMELVQQDTSSLPGTIAGKVDLAYDLMAIGDYDAADIEDMVGLADITQRTNLKRASAKLVMKRVGKMLTEGEPWGPPSYINLPEALILAGQMLCLAEERDVEDERLQLVRDFITQVQARIDAGKAAAPPPQAMLPGGAMLGPGAAAPVLPGAGVPAMGPAPAPAAASGPGPANPMPTLGAAA